MTPPFTHTHWAPATRTQRSERGMAAIIRRLNFFFLLFVNKRCLPDNPHDDWPRVSHSTLTGTLIPKPFWPHREGRSAQSVQTGVVSRKSKSGACKRERENCEHEAKWSWIKKVEWIDQICTTAAGSQSLIGSSRVLSQRTNQNEGVESI